MRREEWLGSERSQRVLSAARSHYRELVWVPACLLLNAHLCVLLMIQQISKSALG